MDEIISHQIDAELEVLRPVGILPVILRQALERVAHVAFQRGTDAALLSLLSAEDVAERLGVSRRRANALIRNRHERFGVGAMVGGRWLVTSAELERLRPEAAGWKKGRRRRQAQAGQTGEGNGKDERKQQ